MKKNKILIFVATVFLINACSKDFLNDPKPLDAISDASFWQTSEDLGGATNGIYNTLSEGQNVSQHWVLTANYPTNDFFSNEDLDVWNMIALNFTPENGRISNEWFSSYQGILKANRVIARGENMNIDADFKAKKIAEAKCLRAYFYLHLIRAYGDVPLLVDEQTAASNPSPARTPMADVLAQMVKDLTEAVGVLPPRWDDANVGRVTKGTALGLLELTNLYKGDWTASLSNFEQLEALGVYHLLPNYMDAFKIDNENNAESILEAQMIDSPNAAFWLQNMCAPPDAGPQAGQWGGWGVYAPTQQLYDELEPGDDRRKQFLTPGETYTLPANGYVYTMKGDGKSMKTNVIFLKYFMGLVPSGNSGPRNIMLLKYAEAVLYYAEALANAGRFDDAYKQINRIRTRVKLPAKAVVNNLQTCITDINKERRIENCFDENGLWYDLLRTKQAKKFLKEEHNIDMADYKYLFPLPQTELDLNKNLTQNPGYN